MEIEELLQLGKKIEKAEADKQELIQQDKVALKARNKKSTPFEFISSIQEKKYMLTRNNIRHYVPFVVTMGISQHVENLVYAYEASVLQANLAGLDVEFANQLHYDYLYNTVRPGKKFGSWAKVEKYDSLDLIMDTYQVNRDKAIDIIGRLTEHEIKQIEQWEAAKHGGLIK